MRWLKAIPLVTKLLIAPSIILALMIGLASFGLTNLSSLIDSVDLMSNDLKNQAQHAAKILKYARQKQYIVEKYISNYSEDIAANYTLINHQLVTELTEFKSSTADQSLLSSLDEIESTNIEYTLLFKKTVLNVKKSDGYFNFTEELSNQLREYADRLALAAESLSDNAWNKLTKEGRSVLSLADILFKTSLIVTVFASFIGVSVTWIVIITIRQQISVLSNALYGIAHGEADLTQRLDESGRDDLSYLAHQFNNFMEMLQSIILDIKGSMSDFDQAATMSAMVSSNTAKKIEQQSEQTEAVATAITELDASSKHVAGIISDTEIASKSASNHAVVGNTVVQQSIISIEGLSNQVNQAVDVIGSLASSSEKIADSSAVIKSIAEQTNLLALNAAIEAARAGEQGRGFAVVADEVRKLATRTHESTTDIQLIIEQLRKDTNNVVSVMQRGRQIASEGVSHSRQAGEALDEITQSNRSVSDMSGQIMVATNEQSIIVSNVQHSILAIQQLAEETVASSKMAEESASNINVITQKVSKLINRFKVNDVKYDNVESVNINDVDDDGFF